MLERQGSKAEFEKLGMDVDHLMAERFEVWAPDAEQGASGFKASIPGFIQIRKALEAKRFDAVIIDSVKGVCSGTGSMTPTTPASTHW